MKTLAAGGCHDAKEGSMPSFRKTACFVLAGLIAAAGLQAQDIRPRDLTAWLVGHAHIDLSWLWDWEETVRDVAVQTFAGTLRQMTKKPGLTFAQSQAALYEAIEASNPDLFRAIRDKVREGTWVPVGGMWVEPDLNMPDGEALARQLLYGKRYFLEKFGVDVKVGWNPDSFGHSWQLPQILAKAGFKYYVFGRCAPDKTVAFTWKGKDGSTLLSYVPQGWYNVGLKDGVKNVVMDAAKISPLKDIMILYGEGDHGGGPRDADLKAIEAFGRDRTHPKLKFTTPEEYFQILEKAKPKLPEFDRELNFTFPGCYTTQVDTKANNRKGEGLLIAAEKISALATAGGYRDYYPERDLDEAWKIVLRNQFHDILDGSSIGPVYDEVRGFYEQAFARGRRELDFSLASITNAVDTRGPGIPVIVYNGLAWPVSGPVDCYVPRRGLEGPLKVLDDRGAEVVYQPERSYPGAFPGPSLWISFVAENVPSLGYALFRVVPSDKAPETASSVSAGPDSLENEFFRIALDPRTGWITSLKDKSRNREILRGPANVLQAIADEPASMSAWELGLKDGIENIGEGGAKVEIVESGPVRAVVRVTSSFRRSTFTRDIILHRGLRRIDFKVAADWQERNVMIKAAFPVDLRDPRAEFEIPFGTVSRPVEGAEVPALRWADVSDADGGAALLNDGRYGYDVKGSVLRISVIRGATNPDPEADRGRHEFGYALVPHAGDWKEGQVVRRGYEFNNPLQARVAMAHPGSLPARSSFVRVEPANVVLSALKMASGYNDRAMIVRLVEMEGRPTDAIVEWPWPVEAWETDLIERPLKKIEGEGTSVRVALAPYEIKTVRITRK
jgi:alpha-mannosidase